MSGYLFVLASNLFFNANSIILIIAYSHFGTPEDSAKIGIALATLAPIYVLLSLQHATSISSNKLDWASSIKIRTYIAPVGMFFSLLGAIFFKNEAILIFSLIKTAEYFYEPLFYRRIQLKQYKKLWKETFTRFMVTGILCISILTYGSLGLNTLLIILGTSHTLLTFYSLRQNLNEIINAKCVTVREDIPLGIGALLASISANIPRYFLINGPVDDLAFYSNALSIIFGLTFLFTSLNTLLLQKFTAQKTNGMIKYQMSSIFIGLIALIVMLAIFETNNIASPFAIKMLLGENYVKYSENIIFFAIFYVILYYQAVANSSLAYSGSKKFIAFYNFLYLLSIIAVLYLNTESKAQDTIISVIWTSGVITALSFTFSLLVLRESKRN